MRLMFALAFLVGSKAFALGIVPNGTYVGTETCTGSAPFSSKIVLTDDRMIWNDQENAFAIDADGTFKFSVAKGSPGRGIGHFTPNGFRYAAEFEIDTGRGQKAFYPGWDSFEYANGELHLESSASMGALGSVSCTGVFSKTP
jgi:hypothetical protein